MPTPTYSLETLLAELTRLPDPPEGYYTVTEWCAHLGGIGIDRCRRILTLAKEQGKLQTAQRFYESLDGRMVAKPVYEIRLGKEG